VPGAASFKRVLDGALFIDARARRAPHGRSGSQALGRCVWAATVLEDVRGAPNTWPPWSGGARELELARASRREAPHASPYQRALAEECLWVGARRLTDRA